MNTACTIRIFSAFIPLALIAVNNIFYPDGTAYWVFLLVVAMVMGYVHFFIGTLYQLKGIFKNKNKNRLLLYFACLAVGALLIAAYLLHNNLEIILGIFTIAYFVLHVLLNEFTFLNRELSFQVPASYLISFLALFTPLFFVSLKHPAFFYDFKLTYPALSNETMMNILQTSYPISLLQILSIVSVLLFTLIAPYLAYTKIGLRTSLVTLLLGLLATVVILTSYPVNFVYMFHFVLVYHFILMFLIFFLYFKNKKPEALLSYLNTHILVTLCVIAIFLLPTITGGNSLAVSFKEGVFNFGVFLTISLMHISVSFLNEPWFVVIMKKFRLLD